VLAGRDEDRWNAHLPQPVADVRAELLRDGSLPARWLCRWGERPSWPQLRDVDGGWVASDELEQRTRRLACALLRQGLAAGDRVLLCGSTGASLVIACVGALRAGLVVVPVNPAYTEPELARIVRDARPAAAVVEDPLIASWVRRAAPRPPVVRWLKSSEPGGLDACSGPADHPGLDGVAAADPALLLYTSGTTGEPKGALLTHGNLLAGATAVNLAWRWRPQDRLLLSLPLFHLHGLGVGVIGTLCAGASVELRPRFEPADVARRCAQGEVSLFFGVPTMYRRLLDEGLAGELRRLRLLVSGSAPLPAALAEQIASQAGQIPLERYGMTETMMLTSNPHDGPRKPGTVGFQLPGVELRLAGDGEVQVRGPNVIRGYWERPDADRESFTDDGWFRTGDLAEPDGDGYLALVGRRKELIISGGYNVHPREVEEAIATHPAVREVAVVGRRSERWGEEVTAVVVAARPVEERELLEHAARRLAAYKVPKRVEFAPRLPRNALGKILRDRL
jgi:malonyl-CoA/methylmalonyl-CoA synthetase